MSRKLASDQPKRKKGRGGGKKESVNSRGRFVYSGLVDTARELRGKGTNAEKFVWSLLRNRKVMGLKSRRQHQIGLYIVDFYCHELKLVLELDGGIHLTIKQREKDKIRDEYLKSEGFKIYRFANRIALDNPEVILQTIKKIR